MHIDYILHTEMIRRKTVSSFSFCDDASISSFLKISSSWKGGDKCLKPNRTTISYYLYQENDEKVNNSDAEAKNIRNAL